MIYIKSDYDLTMIKQAALIWKQVKAMLIETAKAGVSLITLDQKACDLIEQHQATCSFYQHEGFPGHICISVNEQLIHGVPTNYKLKDGDLVSFDVGVTYENHICDAAFAIIIGHNEKAEHILQAANESLTNAINMAKPGNHIGDISAAIEQTAQTHGYAVIKDFGGHGCGIKLHEDPIIMNYGEPHTGARLIKNMTLCVEPMLMTDSDRYIIDSKNKWTVIARNKKITCHVEHMIIINEKGCEILTE